MKQIVLIGIFSMFSILGFSQSKNKPSKPDPNKEIEVVAASCGECNFGMDGKTCDLAVKINGVPYFVDGAKIDNYGDAHAKDGFCVAVRKAEVQGEVVNGRFKASYFKLLDSKTNKKVYKKKD